MPCAALYGGCTLTSGCRCVNYSDPFGLCPACGEGIFQSLLSNDHGYKDALAQARYDASMQLMSKVVSVMGLVTGGAGLARSAARVAETSGDAALVVRGGSNTAEAIAKGAESIDEAGNVHGVSVNSAEGASAEDLAQGIPHTRIGVTTVGAIRAAGGQVVKDATAVNPNHCLVSCISAAKLSDLLTPTVPNPAIPR
jgi:cobyrinic acid a,c-diamide synthase